GVLVLSASGVTTIQLNTRGGDDNVTVGDLTSTGVKLTTIDLGDGSDTLDSTASRTPIVAYGRAGDDHMLAGKGRETLDGGAGNDTIDYSQATHGIRARMNGSVRDSVTGTSQRISTFEVLIGSAFNDVIVGGSTAS